MNKIAIIGGGISGLSMARLLKESLPDAEVTVFEKEKQVGGLIRCEHNRAGLFHTCGGHVFNSKNQQVLDWFWKQFDREKEYRLVERNSVIFLPDDKHIPYPIENYAYLLDSQTQLSFIRDLLQMQNLQVNEPYNDFQSFLRKRFGNTLYRIYFEPYNKKVWRCELSDVPLAWLEGKLPMPTAEEMIYNNFNRVEEKSFVHSSFYYASKDGSQYIVNRLAEGIEIYCGEEVDQVVYEERMNKSFGFRVNGRKFDSVVFCGNVKQLPNILRGIDLSCFDNALAALKSHGTTSVFCEIDQNPYSWIYLPDEKYQAHRIICTGNFSSSNNAPLLSKTNRTTATIEFTDYIDQESILYNLNQMPLHPAYLQHCYNQYTYPIQSADTRMLIKTIKQRLALYGFYITGRFADWEYYNMDAAIAAAMQTIKEIINR